RVLFLSCILALQGIILVTFSGITSIFFGILFLILFSLAVQMAEGATFSVVPFINKKAIGSVSGIVGAGGNVGAFFAALLLKYKSAMAEEAAIAAHEGLSDEAISAAQSLASATAVSNGYLLIGCLVVITAISALAIRFYREDDEASTENKNLESLGTLMPIKVEK